MGMFVGAHLKKEMGVEVFTVKQYLALSLIHS